MRSASLGVQARSVLGVLGLEYMQFVSWTEVGQAFDRKVSTSGWGHRRR